MTALAWEFQDRRALALLVFVDALGARVASPVAVTAPGVRLFAKRPGEVVVMGAPGLAAHERFDAPPNAPPLASLAIPLDIRPLEVGLGARRFTLRLPRDPAVLDPLPADSLFRPVEIPLLPAPGATATGLAASLAVTLRHVDGRRIEGALLRLTPDGGRPEALALTDAAGEALLHVPGVPLSVPGPMATILPDLGATLQAIIDPGVARFHAEADLDKARDAAARRQGSFVDPDALAMSPGASTTPALDLRIAAGRMRKASLTWNPP